MIARKSASHPAAEERLDRAFHALADRTRRALLARLASGPAMVTELAAPFEMSLPAVSKHLKVLERAGLVERAIDGRVHRCSLRAVPLREVEAWVEHYRGFWEDRLDALARYVERDAKRGR
jgi:DNA-binding transcriptional ArsR family regulator